jgi:hypothetical protein
MQKIYCIGLGKALATGLELHPKTTYNLRRTIILSSIKELRIGLANVDKKEKSSKYQGSSSKIQDESFASTVGGIRKGVAQGHEC